MNVLNSQKNIAQSSPLLKTATGQGLFLPKEASVWGASFLPRVAAICHAEEPQIILPERRLKLGNPLTATT